MMPGDSGDWVIGFLLLLGSLILGEGSCHVRGHSGTYQGPGGEELRVQPSAA